jgi:hypothetical protein
MSFESVACKECTIIKAPCQKPIFNSKNKKSAKQIILTSFGWMTRAT